MRPHPSKKAFTLIELLAVICTIVVLGAMLFPSMGPKKHSSLFNCMNNQWQILTGFTIWQSDHHGNFPWQISSTNNGTMELADEGYASPSFNALSSLDSSNVNRLRIFICPTDPIKTVATNGVNLGDQNLSYFLGLDGGKKPPMVILTGDRHLVADGTPVKPGLFAYSNNLDMKWSLELHKSSPSPTGVIGFLDGHAQIVRGTDLDVFFRNQGLVAGRYDVP